MLKFESDGCGDGNAEEAPEVAAAGTTGKQTTEVALSHVIALDGKAPSAAAGTTDLPLLRLEDLMGSRLVSKQRMYDPGHRGEQDLGRITDLYFDDETLEVLYVVVDTGHWLKSHEVLLKPSALKAFDSARNRVLTHLEPDAVRNAPVKAKHKPLSVEQEESVATSWVWPRYWGGSMAPTPITLAVLNGRFDSAKRVNHLRSFSAVYKYDIKAKDGRIGHLEDFLVEVSTWRLKKVIINTKPWWLGGHVVVDIDHLGSIRWTSQVVEVALSCRDVKNAKGINKGFNGLDHYVFLPESKV